MKKITRKGTVISLGSMLTLASFSAVVLSTIAWFSDVKMFTPESVDSSVMTSYFDSGTGTEDDPYVITRPIHYYNLVYLQQSNPMWGSARFSDIERYFQFGKDLDGSGQNKFYYYDNAGVIQTDAAENELTALALNMNYYSGSKAIVPLGSNDIPFIGHINGNGLTVTGLHIDGSGFADIGIFGYVGEGATVDNIYFNSPTIIVDGANPSVSSVTGHTDHSGNAYIGHLAGHAVEASQFTDVYVNSATIQNNAPSSKQLTNKYGYFGHLDLPNTPVIGSGSYQARVDAESAYSAIDNVQSYASSRTAVSRNTSYVGQNIGTLGANLSKDGDTYSLNNTSVGKPASLSTLGYQNDNETIQHYVRYFTGVNATARLSSSTVKLEGQFATEPNWNNYDVGTYVYYDSTNNKWQYAIVTSDSGEQHTVQYNCYKISYTYSGSTYYFKYNAGSLTATTVAPTSISASPDYYFAFVNDEYPRGKTTMSSLDGTGNYRIYSPANSAYIKAPTSGTGGSVTFTETSASGTVFNVSGHNSTLTYMGSSDGMALFATTTITGSRTNAQTIYDRFDITSDGGSQTGHSDTGSTFNIVTNVSDIQDGDIVAIVGKSKFDNYRVLSPVVANDRRVGEEITTTNSGNSFEYVGGMSQLRVDISGGRYSFYDLTTLTYLSRMDKGIADSTEITNQSSWSLTYVNVSGSNLKNQAWSIEANTTTSRRYLLYNSTENSASGSTFTPGSSDYWAFGCYAAQTAENSTMIYPRIYKRDMTTGTNYTYYNATTHNFVVDSGEKTAVLHDLHTAPFPSQNPDLYTNYDQTPFSQYGTDVIFDFAESMVSCFMQTNDCWQKISSASELTSGSEIILINEANSKAMSKNVKNTYYIDEVDITGYLNSAHEPHYISNGSITTDLADVQIITLESAGAGIWYLNIGSNNYLAQDATTYSSLLHTTTKNANSRASISIDSSKNATIQFQGSNSNNKIEYYATSSRFTSYSSIPAGGEIQIYKHVLNTTDENTYIGDLVTNNYDPYIIDVVGQTQFSSDHFNFTSSSVTTPSVGTRFYTTQNINGAIVLTVYNNRSRDLGYITVDYTSTSSPYFFGNDGTTTDMSSTGAKDLDKDSSDSRHKLLLNLNDSNIQELSFCAMNGNDEIVSMGDIWTDNIQYYVIVIGASSSTNIHDAHYVFNSADGNVGGFSSVDYRDADDEKVTRSIISFYYNINSTCGAVMTVYVEFDGDHTYTINITVSGLTEDLVFNFFNYDANNYDIAICINGGETTVYNTGTNSIVIPAS